MPIRIFKISFHHDLPWKSGISRVWGHNASSILICIAARLSHVHVYNALPRHVIQCKTVSTFQHELTNIARIKCSQHHGNWHTFLSARHFHGTLLIWSAQLRFQLTGSPKHWRIPACHVFSAWSNVHFRFTFSFSYINCITSHILQAARSNHSMEFPIQFELLQIPSSCICFLHIF